MRTLIVVGVLVILGLIFLWPGKGQLKALYVVDETEQIIITRFGEVKSVKRSSGLNFKLPFVDTVITFDRRILRIDAPPVPMPDKDKQNLVIDSYARYRIIDPVQFRKTLQTENNARSRLGDFAATSFFPGRKARTSAVRSLDSLSVPTGGGPPPIPRWTFPATL